MTKWLRNCRSKCYEGKKWLALWLFGIALITTTACDSPLLVPEAWLPQQPISPLIPGVNVILTQSPWQVVEITQNGEIITIDAIQPVYITFTIKGYLTVYSPGCFSNTYAIVAENERRYRLRSMIASGAQCGEPKDTQRLNLSKALIATQEFDLQDTQLLLRDDEVQVILENSAH